MIEDRSAERKLPKARCWSLADKPVCARAAPQISPTSAPGIRAQGIAVLLLNFELSVDHFRTIRKCRLRWRDGDFVGAAFES
jgi:hypothetical protein